MQKRLNPEQVLFLAVFVVIVLAAYEFLLPDFTYKSIIFIALGGVSAYIGGTLSTKLIKNQ
ncbi:hypothetical protein [Oceanobacillus jordanicus]|uniref:Uncharacterized protein n=1 Tax=Oceanobacillus jordanicus TaxID=2867266 RepID=A0AAW5B5W4_9BACI|nr:hypothetical protein [Oceanobacillus jordanicus]MCG3419405.1 hypothetical protein [Oceanobacillus jordanicus]